MPSATAAVEAHMRTHPTPEDTRTRVRPLVDSYVNPVDLNHPEPVRTITLFPHTTREGTAGVMMSRRFVDIFLICYSITGW